MSPARSAQCRQAVPGITSRYVDGTCATIRYPARKCFRIQLIIVLRLS